MYEQYLIRLLAPLGVYDFSIGSINRSELTALGAGFDAMVGELERVEREALLMTAETEGLSRREELFLHRPAASTAAARRAAITALLQIDGDSLTPTAINRTLHGCGVRAVAREMGEGLLQVRFPETAGVPEGFEQMKRIILEILPCHLAVEFYFRYLTWKECEAAGYIWAQIEAAEHTWETLQLAVPAEE